MAGRVGFHQNHGSNIRLLEEGTVAHRVKSYDNGIVFSEQPIVIGDLFQVKQIEKGGRWAGSLVSIITFCVKLQDIRVYHIILLSIICILFAIFRVLD